MLEPGATCQVKSVLTTCGATATAQCVYCARAFCPKHGEVLEDGYEVCTRKPCLTKKRDLTVHLTYKSAVLERNRQRLCGIHVCVTELQVQCNRCRGYFCAAHTQPWLETVTEKPERTCAHCLGRRSIWELE
jgi:predicted nucleic acid binding AN1-type Zn finger protein